MSCLAKNATTHPRSTNTPLVIKRLLGALIHGDRLVTILLQTMKGRSRINASEAEWCDELSKKDRDKINPTLGSLVIPWMLLAMCAFGAAAMWSCPDSREEPSLDIGRSLGDREFEVHHHHAEPVYIEDHEPLLPLSNNDYIGFGCAIVGLVIAAGGGIGGGGLLVPIYVLVMGFSPKHAIPLSNITVLGGALANTILNVPKRHPLADRPLVDWDLILVMEPLTIAGALIGAFLNKVLPERLLVVMLVLLLSFTAYGSLKKAIKMYKIETIKLREQGYRPDGTKESELTRMAGEDEDVGQGERPDDELLKNMQLHEGEQPGDGEIDVKTVEGKMAQELADLLEEERRAPAANIMILVAMFLVVLTINILKGGGAFPSPLGIKCGSQAFWIANALMLGWILTISFFVRAYLVRRYETKERVAYQYVEGDIKWDSRATIVYPCICAFAGFFAGMFGVGGGIVKGPLMLAMGVHPAVSSASSATMILFTSFTATTSFVVFGLLVADYAPICFGVGFVSTFFGQIGLSYLMKRAQRNSYIAFSIGAVVLLSAILMTIQSVLSMAEGEQHHSGGICGKDE